MNQIARKPPNKLALLTQEEVREIVKTTSPEKRKLLAEALKLAQRHAREVLKDEEAARGHAEEAIFNY